MMSVSDILQLVALCAVIFFPLGYAARHSVRRLTALVRPLFFKPRYLKPVGTLHRRTDVKADQQHD
ncbi:membrane protein [Franconibacter daqui]|uniref:cellulose biosynthesis protein BcsF n=1 Tax=Franconibacter daqui TaxID=2047724 RepID=UPI001662D827|nr:cellulose biosynthesis protein BcsF [Franconibacter daqui]GGD29922.1 membrane protein [Franconibacter daqui]